MRIREYPKVTSYDPTDVILIDKGTGGTKQLELGDLGISGQSGGNTSNLNNIVLKTLTVAGWQLNGGVYTQTINFTKIHSLMPYIVPCGNAIGTLPTDEQESAFGSLQCIGDTTANTMTFYADAAPTVAINIVVQGVE